MPFSNTTTLSNREQPSGGRWLGQVAPVPSGRLDKVSFYLEPEIADSSVADGVMVIVEAYALSAGLPSGVAIASDSKTLSEVAIRGFSNFRLQAYVPTTVAIVLRVVGGDADNFVAWRYQPTPTGGQNLLISSDDGVTWSSDSNRKFSYVAYSFIEDAIDHEDQSAAIGAGRLVQVVDDTGPEFSLATLTRAAVTGDTVAIAFGNFVITLVVDQSGSMTWNDHDGLRFDFLKQYVNDIESILPVGSTATYSLVEFRSRKVGRIDVVLQGGAAPGSDVAGVRIVRNASHYPLTAADGIAVYEGLAENALDQSLASGTRYFYSAFAFDQAGNFSESRIDYAQPTASITPPMGVAGFTASEVDVLSGDIDVGVRQVMVAWSNPQGFDYDSVTLIRRDDRAPNSPDDFDGVHGVALLVNAPTTTTSTEDFPSSFNPTSGAINGHTYFYGIFTKNGNGLKCFSANTRGATVAITLVDRVWDRAQPPSNVPPAGFPTAQPAAPTGLVVTIGDGKIQANWVAGDAATRRFLIWHQPTRPPIALTASNGAQDYDGDLAFEGTGTSFVHRNLDNAQPNFYVIVARDVVNNQSAPFFFTATPIAGAASSIPPPPVSSFEAEVQDSTSNGLSWGLPIPAATAITGYFGDAIRATANVTFADTEGGTSSAHMTFVERDRTILTFDPAAVVDAGAAIQVANAPSIDASAITAVVTATPLLSQLNQISTSKVDMYASLRVVKPDGTLIQEVITPQFSVTLQNPFDLKISNDPPQSVSRRIWSGTCSADSGPMYNFTNMPGVYVNSGNSFNVSLDASFRGAALASNISLLIRVLDADTGLPSPNIVLPGSAGGVLSQQTATTVDEVVDRSGQPTGQSVAKTSLDLSLPPQSIPGDYILEVTGSYLGYTRVVTLPMHFEPILNLDVDALAFSPNGVDIAEQKAFVYFGPFDAPSDEKTPVPDLTVVDWTLTLLGGNTKGKARPFFSLDNVPSAGVKSYTHSGIARDVFFGPGADVEPPTGVICTDGEMWQIQATAKVGGQVVSGYAAVEILPPTADTLNKIFLRSVDGGFNNENIFADGADSATFEVVANPENYGDINDPTSGAFFRNAVVGLGGAVPSLDDGRIITMFALPYKGSKSGNLVITTDLSPKGATGAVQATVIGGKATFKVSLDAFVGDAAGVQPPLPGEASNVIYGDSFTSFVGSPIVLALTAIVIIEVNGQAVPFVGGTGDPVQGTPPIYVSFKEPLQS